MILADDPPGTPMHIRIGFNVANGLVDLRRSKVLAHGPG